MENRIKKKVSINHMASESGHKAHAKFSLLFHGISRPCISYSYHFPWKYTFDQCLFSFIVLCMYVCMLVFLFILLISRGLPFLEFFLSTRNTMIFMFSKTQAEWSLRFSNNLISFVINSTNRITTPDSIHAAQDRSPMAYEWV